MKNADLTAKTNRDRSRLLLERILSDLRGNFREVEELQVESMADELDQVQSNADRELAIQRLDNKVRMIRDVRVALRKLNEGSYGVCDNCDEPISARRLEAIPWAPLCVACQAKSEMVRTESSTELDLAA